MEKQVTYTGYRWFVMFMAIILVIAQGMLLIAPTPLIGEISTSLGVKDLGAVTGSLMAPFAFLVAIGGLFSGFIMDRIGIAKTMIIGALLAAVASFLMPMLGTSLGSIGVLRAIQGLGCGPVIASGAKIAAEWFPKNQRSLYQGIFGASLSLGITLGLVLGPKIAASNGWTMVMVAFGGVMTVGLVLAVIFNFGQKPPIMSEQQGGTVVNMKNVFGRPLFWITLLAAFALSWVMQGYNDLTPGHLAIDAPVGLGLGAEVAGSIMSLYSLAFMFGALASAFVAEKIFRGKYGMAITTTFALTTIFCFSVVLTPVNSNQTVLTICLILAGFFMGMPNSMAQSSIANYYPENVCGAVGGSTMGISCFGGTLGVAVGSFALSQTGAYFVSIIVVCIVCIIGAIAGLGIKKSMGYNWENN